MSMEFKQSAGFSRRAFVAASALSLLGPAKAWAQSNEFDVSRFRGKVLYLDFWASWCGPCQQSFPYMNHLVAAYTGRDFSLLAVNVDHDRASADSFLHQFGGSVPIVFDPAGALAARYHVRAMPTAILLDRDGRQRFVHAGFYPEQIIQYDSQIAELLHEQ